MSNFKLLEKVKTILLHSNQELTAREIASKIVVKYLEDCDKKYENSTNPKKLEKDKETFLVEQIQAEIPKDKDLLNKHNIIITNERPCKYFYKENKNISDLKQMVKNPEEKQNVNNDLKEKDLYKIFIKYLYKNNIYGMRIDEKVSSHSKKGTNKWLHPDIVAIKYLGKDWEDEIKDFTYFFNKQTLKIYSYEIKLNLNISNIREAYFQTVSNSSWANHAYLVLPEKIDDETKKELEVLVPLYGIGVMQIDKENNKTKILFSAREKEDIDFNILNKLYANEDIKKFIEIIGDFYGCNEKVERLKEDIKREFKKEFNEELS